MSRQLAISSTFASFAMAALALTYAPSGIAGVESEIGGFGLQVEKKLPDLPSPPLLPN